MVFGDPKAIAKKLTSLPTSTAINTSYVERNNLTQRQSNRRLTRRTNGFSKDLSWFERQLWLSLAYYHLALPHLRLRQPLPEPEATRGSGSLRRWQHKHAGAFVPIDFVIHCVTMTLCAPSTASSGTLGMSLISPATRLPLMK